jgi:hypothetical protein
MSALSRLMSAFERKADTASAAQNLRFRPNAGIHRPVTAAHFPAPA